MLRIHRVLASSLAVILIAGAMSPVAHAWPLGKAHLHPESNTTQAALITVQLHNKGTSEQAVKVNGTVYSIPASEYVTIKAPAGTQVLAETAGEGYNKGDVLYVMRSDLKGATVSFN